MTYSTRSDFFFHSRPVLASVLSIALLCVAGTFQPASARETPETVKAAGMQVPGFWKMTLGEVTVTALYDGKIDLSPSLLKGIETADFNRLLGALYVPRNKNGVQTAVNAYLIQQGGKLILIDAGAAQCFGPTLGKMLGNLKAAGIDPSMVDTVIVTHLHGDHVCGATLPDGKMAFPNAELLAPRKDADYWLSEEVAAKMPESAKAFFKAARDAVAPYKGAGKFRTFEDGEDPIPGIKAVPSNGHTPGHTSYLVAAGDQQLLIWGDIVHSYSIQFPRPKVSIEFDTDQRAAIATREKLLSRAAEGKLWIAGAHMPFPGIGHVVREGKGWRWAPAEYGLLDQSK